jgi:acetyl-CoA carboxylase biotin carboxyl carrier protein
MSGKLTHKDVQDIFAIIDSSDFDELHLETEGLKLTVRRQGATLAPAPVSAPAIAVSAPVAEPAKAVAPPVSTAPVAGLVDVSAPMLGVFYRAPKPGADPYVTPGAKIAPDTVIGIIEVMKLMNPVPAGISGEVVEIIASDGVMIEFGQVILRVRPE